MKLLEHSGIVKLYDSGKQGVMLEASGTLVGNVVYIVMEYVPG